MKDVDHRNQRLIGPKIYMTWTFCSVQILRLVFEFFLLSRAMPRLLTSPSGMVPEDLKTFFEALAPPVLSLVKLNVFFSHLCVLLLVDLDSVRNDGKLAPSPDAWR